MKLTQSQIRRLVEAETKSVVADEISTKVATLVGELLSQHFSSQHLKRDTLRNIVVKVQNLLHDEVSKLS